MMNIVLSENKFKQGQIYEAKKKTRDILDNGHFDDGGDLFIFCEDGRCVRADEYGSYPVDFEVFCAGKKLSDKRCHDRQFGCSDRHLLLYAGRFCIKKNKE